MKKYTPHILVTIGIAVLALLYVLFSQNKTETVENPAVDSEITEPQDPEIKDSPFAEYINQQKTISIEYPKDYTVNEEYHYEGFGPSKRIPGVSFSVPSRLTENTNLSLGTKISFESITEASSCLPDMFIDAGAISEESSIQEDGRNYQLVEARDAGAGNRYEQTLYVFNEKDTCWAVRYFIHYSAIENYPEGSIGEFNKNELLKEFDTIRKTFTFE